MRVKHTHSLSPPLLRQPHLHWHGQALPFPPPFSYPDPSGLLSSSSSSLSFPFLWVVVVLCRCSLEFSSPFPFLPFLWVVCDLAKWRTKAGRGRVPGRPRDLLSPTPRSWCLCPGPTTDPLVWCRAQTVCVGGIVAPLWAPTLANPTNVTRLTRCAFFKCVQVPSCPSPSHPRPPRHAMHSLPQRRTSPRAQEILERQPRQ